MAKRISKRASPARSPKRRKKKRLKTGAPRLSKGVRPQMKRKRIKKIPKSLVKEKIFDFQPRKIKLKVVGIGGGGGSIVSEIAPKLKKIKCLAANTDSQALRKLTREIEKFSFGQNFTQGLGTGMDPGLAERAAQEEVEKIKKVFQGQDFTILISCLGGGTGSGASPVFAKAAKDLKNHTLGIFTLPFLFEGGKRQDLALSALEKIKPNLNTVIIFPNERIFQVISQKTPIREAFSAVNKILAENLEGLIEMLYSTGLINIDFADLKTILSGRGRLSFLHTILIQGENRAEEIAKKILENPFYEYKIKGADRILFNISGGKDLKITEVEKISKAVSSANRKAKIIFGISENEKYKGKIKITLLAVGCREEPKIFIKPIKPKRKIYKIKKRTKKAVPRSLKDKKEKKKKGKRKLKKGMKTKGSEKKLSPPLENAPEKEEKIEMKIRRNALELKQETERVEKEHLAKESEWDIPAFLRRKAQR